MSADILKQSIIRFKQLRSVELSDAVFMSDFGLWEILGTLPSLANLTLKATDPASHPAHAPEIKKIARVGVPSILKLLKVYALRAPFSSNISLVPSTLHS